MKEDRIVGDDIALPPNRILSAWIGKLQEVVVVGTDAFGERVVAASCSGDRARTLLAAAEMEIDALSVVPE